ncbi:ATPase, T2SS/T4P/T4SS family (plasmid) [Rossellomorea sp. AcN35-11]|nr:ATPase, T2SS/T4P/T4SS family [Rossellomorea sp. AcN35-11]
MGDKYLDEVIEKIESSDAEKQLGLDAPFDSSKWLSQTIEEKGLKQSRVTTYARKKSFKHICKTVRDELKELIVIPDGQKVDSNDSKHIEWLDRQHKAVIGDEKAMNQFIYKITEVLRKHNIVSDDYPTFYESLSEAIFHEIWGLSILYKWEKYPESEAAVIRGKQLWFDMDGKFVKQPEEFEDDAAVERVKRAFTLRSKDAVINDQTPELEIEREDGSRITMMQRPRSRETYIMFRRFVVKDISLAEQARLGTIPDRDIEIYRAFSRTMCNIVFAGRVRSAKTTFLKSMIRERDPEFVAAIMEKHFELRLTEHLKDRLVFEVQAKEGDLHNAMPRLLRMEHDYIIVGEIRSLETEGYLQARAWRKRERNYLPFNSRSSCSGTDCKAYFR